MANERESHQVESARTTEPVAHAVLGEVQKEVMEVPPDWLELIPKGIRDVFVLVIILIIFSFVIACFLQNVLDRLSAVLNDVSRIRQDTKYLKKWWLDFAPRGSKACDMLIASLSPPKEKTINERIAALIHDIDPESGGRRRHEEIVRRARRPATIATFDEWIPLLDWLHTGRDLETSQTNALPRPPVRQAAEVGSSECSFRIDSEDERRPLWPEPSSPTRSRRMPWPELGAMAGVGRMVRVGSMERRLMGTVPYTVAYRGSLDRAEIKKKKREKFMTEME